LETRCGYQYDFIQEPFGFAQIFTVHPTRAKRSEGRNALTTLLPTPSPHEAIPGVVGAVKKKRKLSLGRRLASLRSFALPLALDETQEY